MRKIKWILILTNLLALLIYFNYAVIKKEDILKTGQLVLIPLAPVDPRSLMQGDYMILNYDLSQDINQDNISKRGYCVVKLNKNNITEVVRLQNNITPLHTGEKVIKYTSTNNIRINIGAESYFFQEGQAERYNGAKYGGIKIDEKGNSLLIGLYNEQLKKIE